jgi:hypothetical protein
MKRNSITGFFLGIAGGIFGGIAVSLIWFDIQMSGYLDNMQKDVDQAKHQDTYLNLRFIQMVENGETERLIRAYCTLLHMRLKYLDPESIEDTDLRIKVIKDTNEAEQVVARLESEGKCLTKR